MKRDRILRVIIVLETVMLVGVLVFLRTEGWSGALTLFNRGSAITIYPSSSPTSLSARASTQPPVTSGEVDLPSTLARFNLGTESYAVKGDVNALLAIIEFSDYQ